jgi:hypothetical protein
MTSFVRLAALSLAAACTSEPRRNPAAVEPPLLRFEARDFAFTGPTTATAGLTRVRLVNRGPAWHEALITRLPDSVTADAYVAAARAGEAFPVGADDAGGPGKVAAGDSSDVILDLEPGRYAVVCWSDSHVKVGMIASFVIAVGEAKPSTADQRASRDADSLAGRPANAREVRLEDFRIAHDSGVYQRGLNVLHVRNTGARPHDVTYYRLAPGRTIRDFGAWSVSRKGVPPATPVGGMVTLAPGRDGWVELELLPGHYFAACGTPESGPDGVRIHAQMGMIDVFEVP